MIWFFSVKQFEEQRLKMHKNHVIVSTSQKIQRLAKNTTHSFIKIKHTGGEDH